MRSFHFYKPFRFGLALLLTLSVVMSANAAAIYGLYAVNEDGGVEFTYTYELYKGDEVEGILAIRNYTEDNLLLDVAAVDASDNFLDSFSLKSLDHEKLNVGSWITVDTSTLMVPAAGTELLGFTLSLPENVVPGKYAGGLVVNQSENGDNLSNTGLKVVSQQGMRVYLTVLEGERPEDIDLAVSLGLDDIKAGSALSINDSFSFVLMLMLVLNMVLLLYFVFTQNCMNRDLIKHVKSRKK